MTNIHGDIMLESLFGSKSAERILLFLFAREEGYPTEIARLFRTDLYGIQRKLDGLEAGGIVASKKVGRTRVYTFNPGYPLLAELKAILAKAITFYPEELTVPLLMNRRRPRRRGKPI
ncbi:MAG TPA: winged helix-turn-helix domain-containing protein [Anaerolineales bacterium]|nr:winged helix-turn-helix domain-containing protein [Anaerolineales bacterium]